MREMKGRTLSSWLPSRWSVGQRLLLKERGSAAVGSMSDEVQQKILLLRGDRGIASVLPVADEVK